MAEWYGKYRGEVIDNKDEEKRGRILVTIPSFNDLEVGWAEACLPPNTFTIPQRGDFVWVEFEEGDVGKPIWVGILPTNDYYKKLIPEYDPKNVVIKSLGKFDVGADKDVSMESKTSMTVKGSSATNINSGGAVSVSGASLVNSSKWAIDDIGNQ